MKRILALALLLAAAIVLLYGYSLTRRERLYRQSVMQGDAALARGDAFAAASHFGDAIALKPESMLGYLKRGEAHSRRGDLDAAAIDLERAVALDPTAPRAAELLGDVEAARQHHARAADRYSASVTLDDRSPRVLYKLGLARYSTGQVREAADAAMRAVRLDARFAEAQYLLGLCQRDLDRPREAEDAFKRALTLSPALLPAREQLADLYGAQGRRTARLAELERLLSADPTPARHVTLALGHAAAGDTPRAIRLLGNAAALYPDRAGVYLALGRVWLETIAAQEGDRVAIDKAVEAFQHAAALDPASSSILAALGTARLAAEDPPGAERILRQATDLLPVDADAFLHLADAAERNGHAQAARRALLDYTALAGPEDPRRTSIVQRLGDLSIRLGEPRAAVDWYQQLPERQRDAPELLAQLALAQAQAGERAAARATLDRLFARIPDDPAGRTVERRFRLTVPPIR